MTAPTAMPAPPRPSDTVIGRPDRRTSYALTVVTNLDGQRTYSDPASGDPIISVTSVLAQTRANSWLADWGGKTAAQWATDHHGLIGQILADATRDDAITLISKNGRRIRQVKADAGKWVHECVARLIYELSDTTGRTISLPALPEDFRDIVVDDDTGMVTQDFVDACTMGFYTFVEDWSPTFLAAEMTVGDLDEGYAGTLDGILEILIGADTLRADYGVDIPDWVSGLVRVRVYFDVKTGKRLDLTWQAQMAAYKRAPLALLDGEGAVPILPAPEGVPTLTAVLHLRPEYERGYRLMLVSPAEDAEGWEEFCEAFSLYMRRLKRRGKPGRVLYPPLPDGSQPPMRLADLDFEGYGGAPSALLKVRDEAGAPVFVTVADLDGWSRTQLLSCRGVGEAAVTHIERIVADHGYALATAHLDNSLLDGELVAVLAEAGHLTAAEVAVLSYGDVLALFGGKKLKTNRVRKWLLAEGHDFHDPTAPAPARAGIQRNRTGVA